MSGNTPNVSRDSFDISKLYQSIRLQQGVPIVDSDWNEESDVQNINLQLAVQQLLGNGRYPAVVNDITPGYQIEESVANNLNNFRVSAGWASLYGAIVPTIYGDPPTFLEYEQSTNYLFTGEVSSVGGGSVVDLNMFWEAGHLLPGCKFTMLSGAAIGTTFAISALDSATSLSLSGGTGAIAPGDNYRIWPPDLVKPPIAGGTRTDEVYLMVWFDDINSDQDSNIENPALGVECSHRTQVRWCIRVAEDGTTPVTSSRHGYGIRYMKLAPVVREENDDEITTSMITNEPASFVPALLGSQDASTPGAGVVGNGAISGSPNTISAGYLSSQLGDLLLLINTREQNQSAAASSSWVKIWQSDNAGDGGASKNTQYIYFSDKGWILLTGGYLTAGGTVTANSGDDAASVASLYIGKVDGFGLPYTNGTMTLHKAAATSGTTWGLFTLSSWTSYTADVEGAIIRNDVIQSLGTVSVAEENAFIEVGKGNVDGNDLWKKILGTSAGSLSSYMYIGQNGIFRLGFGCYWDESASTWKSVAPSITAVMLSVGSNGIIMYRMDVDNALHATGWTDLEWGTEIDFLQTSIFAGDDGADDEDVYSCAMVRGEVYDRVPFYTRLFNDTGSTGIMYMGESCNFHQMWYLPPTSVVGHITTDSGGITPELFILQYPSGDGEDRWGCYVHTNITEANGVAANVGGYIEVLS